MDTRLSLKKVSPKGFACLDNLEKYIVSTKLDKKLKLLIKIRVSLLNNCFYCIDVHTRAARKLGESERRIYALSAWEEAPFFTPAERAVFALTDAITLIEKGVPDE